MKFKALRTKREPKEFVEIYLYDNNTYILYTGTLPNPQPTTATLEGLKKYYAEYMPPLPPEIKFEDFELVEFECKEISFECL